MNNFVKTFLFSLIAITFLNPVFGQKPQSKVFSPDNTIISKSIIQKREITKYFDSGAFRCGFFSTEGECDYEKIRNIIWQCWNEKILCYLTISSSSVDASRTEHIFIEPNKRNQWLVVRRAENSHTIPKFRKPIHDLPIVHSVTWRKDKSEQILIFKNKFGRIIEVF